MADWVEEADDNDSGYFLHQAGQAVSNAAEVQFFPYPQNASL